jgi:rod shape-determining protein MreD
MALDLSARKAENTARLMVPQLLLLLLLLLNVAALPLPYADSIQAHLVLMAVYYWAIYRPTLVPPSLCFAVGLAMDVLGGFPLGLNALVLVMVQWLVRDQRKFLMGQAFIVIWAAFGLVALSVSLVQWGMDGLLTLQWVPVLPMLAGTMASLLLFPIVTMLLVATHRLLPVPPRIYS